MRRQHHGWNRLMAAMLAGLVGVAAVAVAVAGEQFLPVLSIREGTTRSLQIPLADGYIAYQNLAEDHTCKGVGECHPYRKFEGMQPSR
jgi:hypothetical protein